MSKLFFRDTTAKNFRGVGNMPLTFSYEDSARKLVVSSENGDGKSTMALQALYYCLFDKAYDKGCNKTALVNTRSGKECLVETRFATKGSEWTVRRGMKPTVFDIIRDGVRVEDEAALADYQKYLEETVLGFDEKAFQNSACLGKDKFVPFVEMDASTRRAYAEQMLDSAVFTQMSDETKTSAKLLKAELETIKHDRANLQTRYDMTKQQLAEYDAAVTRAETQIGAELAVVQANIDKAKAERAALIEEGMRILSGLDGKKPADPGALDKAKTMAMQARTRIAELNRHASNIGALTTCPVCKQTVTDEHKHGVSEDVNRQLSVLTPGLARVEATVAEMQAEIESFAAVQQAAQQKRVAAENLGFSIQQSEASAERLRAMAKGAKDEAKAAEIVENMDNLAAQLEASTNAQAAVEDDLNAHLYLISALKDDGAKAQYVKEYIPFLNEKINMYLDAMGLYVQITLDEEFGVTMYAPDRKGQTISNLSTGQRCRVNLAILLAWRALANAKASVDTNILIMDEVLENLSAQGVVDFMEMMEKTGQGVNLVVISQRNQEFAELFDDVVYYTTRDGFQVQEDRQ